MTVPSIFTKKMEKDMFDFKENVDAWIKQIRSEFSQITDVSTIVEENANNVQHNYELIHELKDHIDDLKKEVNKIEEVYVEMRRRKL